MISDFFRIHFILLFRSTERANPYFLLQRRRGHDERRSGLTSFFVATMDSVLDNKVYLKINLFK